MRRPLNTTLAALGLGLLLAGCSSMRDQTRTTAPAPAGPVVAATTDRATIPAGTTIAVRTNELITSEQPARTYTAQVVQDIVNQNGEVLVPRGAQAELAIVQTSTGGAVGTPTMDLAIRSIEMNGRRYTVSTGAVEERGDPGLGANRRTAEMVGGGALLGTLIGAVAGGGTGAAIGAVVGGAGGAAAQVLTRGSEIRVPPETILTFRLDQPWQLHA
jgi:hypothetical protein